jgi:hypothetical protein
VKNCEQTIKKVNKRAIIERERERERREKKKPRRRALVFSFVGATGQLSNLFIRDLVALKALLDLIE